MATPPLSYRHRSPRGPDDTPAPAVFLLHGRGADETDLLPLAEPLPERVHIFSLRGPYEFEEGYAWYRLAVGQGGLRNRDPESDSLQASVTDIVETLSVLFDQFSIAPTQVGLLGFSQGGTVSLAAMTHLADRIAWTAALHAYLPRSHQTASRLKAAREVAVFLSAGETDLVVQAKRTAQTHGRLADAGVSVAYNTYPTGHTVGSTERDDLMNWLADRI